MSTNSIAIKEAQVELAILFKSFVGKWLMGGSCALQFYEVPIEKEPRDIDIYVDTEDAPLFYKKLEELAVDQLEFNETDRYRSHLAHFILHGVKVELVGGFQVRNEQSLYMIQIERLLVQYSHTITVAPDASIALMPLGHELLFNVLRERPDRYRAIAEVVMLSPERHLPALQAIIRHNSISEPLVQQLDQLLDGLLLSKRWN